MQNKDHNNKRAKKRGKRTLASKTYVKARNVAKLGVKTKEKR